MNGFLPVRVNLPLDLYKRLYAEAESKNTTVSEVLVQRATVVPGRKIGRPSLYTSRVGEDIWAARRLGVSWAEIARRFDMASRTARDWCAKYEREEQARERGERRTA